MPFHDLNVNYSVSPGEVSHTLAFHAELGYTVIALSISVTGKLPAPPQIISLSNLTIPKSVTVLTRLTFTVSDSAQNHRLASLQPHYDLIALRPTTEKTFQLCCGSLECDLISLDLSQRLPFILKFKTVASALQRGVRFEICYSPGITGGNDGRRNLISGATALIRATRGRGIVLSSEAKNALGVRGPHDVINLAQIWGLGQERGKEALCEEAGKVVRLARLKRTSFRGAVDFVADGQAAIQPLKKEMVVNQVSKSVGGKPSQNKEVTSNGIKRKISTTSISAEQSIEKQDTKTLSKHEIIRKNKKPKGSQNAMPDSIVKGKAEKFPIKQEASYKPKKVN